MFKVCNNYTKYPHPHRIHTYLSTAYLFVEKFFVNDKITATSFGVKSGLRLDFRFCSSKLVTVMDSLHDVEIVNFMLICY